jgi:signal transduction histidine kinase
VSNFSKSTVCSSQRTDIKKLVQQNWKLWQLISKKNNLILDAKIEANLPYINGDQSCLQQILTSLITNASLVIKKGAICISVSKESSSHDSQEMIFFKVMGNPGMPVEQLENIFNPGFRDASNQGKVSLYLSNQIIEKLGGRIYLENNKNSGSIFVVELPLLKEQ